MDVSDLAGLIYTSGTTGDPKGVRLSHGNFTSNINAVAEIFPLEEDDRSASFLPWAHSFGQTVELHTLIRFGSSTGLTSAKTLIRDMPEIQPTILVSVPTVFNKVYDGLKKRMEAEGGITKKLFDAAVSNGRKRIQLEKQGKRSRWIDTKNDLFDKIIFTKVRAFVLRLAEGSAMRSLVGPPSQRRLPSSSRPSALLSTRDTASQRRAR